MRFAIRILHRDLVVSLAAIASPGAGDHRSGGVPPGRDADPSAAACARSGDAGLGRRARRRRARTHVVQLSALRGSRRRGPGARGAGRFQLPVSERRHIRHRRRRRTRVREQFVSGNGFDMLGVTPALGRVIVPSDDDLGGGRAVAVLCRSFWTRRFGRDPHVVGRAFTLERNTYQIVGVAREGFTGIEPGISTSLWMPLTSTPEQVVVRRIPGWHWFKVMGRLSPGHRADEVRRGDAGRADELSPRACERCRGDAPRAERERFLGARLVVRSASNGISGLRAGLRAAVVDPGRGRDARAPARRAPTWRT